MDSNHYELIEGRYGRFLTNPRDVYIGRSMIRYGEFSQQEVDQLLALIPSNGVVIEAGANMGSITVPIAKQVGTNGLVYAFEPQMLVFQQLCANLALNNLVNVQAIPAGCGAGRSELRLARLNPTGENNFGGISIDRLKEESSPISIPIEKLDDAVTPHRLDMIKADVEGMETEVLIGAGKLISRFRPILYLENHEQRLSGRLLSELFSMDYECWWHLPAMFNPHNYFGCVENIFGNIVSINMICLPSERNIKVDNGRMVNSVEDHPSHWS